MPDPTPDAAAMLTLAERVEQASGPGRELDAAVFRAIGAPVPFQFANKLLALTLDEAANAYFADIGEMRVRYEPPAYTASLDAAMMLVPEGWHIQFSDWTEPTLIELGPWMAVLHPPGVRTGANPVTFKTRCQHAATPALALAVASLRARAAMLDKRHD